MDPNLTIKVIGIAAPQDIIDLWNQLPYGKRSGIICEAIRTGITAPDSAEALTQYCAAVNSRLDSLEAAMRKSVPNTANADAYTWGEQAIQQFG